MSDNFWYDADGTPKSKPTNHYPVLSNIIKQNGFTLGVEVGVLRGKNFFYQLDANKDLRLVGIDQWRRRENKKEEAWETYNNFDMELLKKKVSERAEEYGDRARVMVMDSAEAASCFPDNCFDFVFLDASHDYESTKRDILSWLPKVHYEGILCGHDHYWPTVQKALNECLPGWNAGPESVWTYPKVLAL